MYALVLEPRFSFGYFVDAFPRIPLDQSLLQAMEKDVASLGVATDRIRVYRPLTGAKDYSRAKLRESYERVSVDRARGFVLLSVSPLQTNVIIPRVPWGALYLSNIIFFNLMC